MIKKHTIVMGLYEYIRNGKYHRERYEKVVNEMSKFIEINEVDRSNIIFLAGDTKSAENMELQDLKVTKVFDDAPNQVLRNKAHIMKFYMTLWAVNEYGSVLWIDWDNIILKWPDKRFWNWCEKYNTLKFTYIPDYWTTVNCGVCFINFNWRNKMERWENLSIKEPNDELIWKEILPGDVTRRHEFWFGDMALNIWYPEDVNFITNNTYFAHVRTFDYYNLIMNRLKEVK